MPIPNSQLETWSNPGPTISSSNTYQSIKNALEHSNSLILDRIKSKEIKIYLQGSYANDTNIRGDSDVDIVVEHTGAFHSNKNKLSYSELQLHEQTYGSASYGFYDLRNDVIKALQLYFGNAFVDTTGNKSIKILPNNGRLRADIVPVISYRKYSYFNGMYDHGKEVGVSFNHKTTNKTIFNFPEHLYQNGVTKHSDTKKLFKPTVRIFKNATSYLIDNNKLTKAQAPSYFLQCMLYNVPNDKFGGSYQDTVVNVLNYLYSADLSSFVCQHEMHKLFGNEDTYWNIADAKLVIAELIKLWNEWYV